MAKFTSNQALTTMGNEFVIASLIVLLAISPQSPTHVCWRVKWPRRSVVTLATIRARIWGIPIATANDLPDIAANATLPEPQPASGSSNEFESLLHQVIDLMENVEGVAIYLDEFQKNDESTDHKDCSAIALNLRANQFAD
jgi:hypothetical protein